MPSPLKSPILTSTHVTSGFQEAHKLVVNAVDPLESPTNHWPACRYRPTMSAFPSPLKSPVCTSTQVTFGFHWAHRLVVKLEPVLSPVHQLPPCKYRPVMSALPSPEKSATWTSTQVTLGFQVSHRLVVNPVDPLERLTYHCPV